MRPVHPADPAAVVTQVNTHCGMPERSWAAVKEAKEAARAVRRKAVFIASGEGTIASCERGWGQTGRTARQKATRQMLYTPADTNPPSPPKAATPHALAGGGPRTGRARRGDLCAPQPVWIRFPSVLCSLFFPFFGRV